jgi:uncharacterized membrane protein
MLEGAKLIGAGAATIAFKGTATTPIFQGIIDLHHDIFFFLIIFLVFVVIAFATKFIIVQMNRGQRSRAALSGDARLTAGASSSAGGGERERKNEKKREDLRKKCMREGVKWCKAYFQKYNIVEPGITDPSESFDWHHFTDCVLQKSFKYQDSDMAGLKKLLDLIKTQSGEDGFWPTDVTLHDLHKGIEKNLGGSLNISLRPGPGSPF